MRKMSLRRKVLLSSIKLCSFNLSLNTCLHRRYIDEMSGEQLARFEFFVRSHFTKKKIKDIISSAGREEVSDEVAIVVASLAKLFVGELVEVCK